VEGCSAACLQKAPVHASTVQNLERPSCWWPVLHTSSRRVEKVSEGRAKHRGSRTWGHKVLNSKKYTPRCNSILSSQAAQAEKSMVSMDMILAVLSCVFHNGLLCRESVHTNTYWLFCYQAWPRGLPIKISKGQLLHRSMSFVGSGTHWALELCIGVSREGKTGAFADPTCNSWSGRSSSGRGFEMVMTCRLRGSGLA
jgi:hypothetical protein